MKKSEGLLEDYSAVSFTIFTATAVVTLGLLVWVLPPYLTG